MRACVVGVGGAEVARERKNESYLEWLTPFPSEDLLRLETLTQLRLVEHYVQSCIEIFKSTRESKYAGNVLRDFRIHQPT